MRPVLRCFITLTFLSTLLTSGCALRATTDFGPGDEPHRRSVAGGAGPFARVFSSDDHDHGEVTTVPND